MVPTLTCERFSNKHSAASGCLNTVPGHLRCVFFQCKAADRITETKWMQKSRAHRRQLLPVTQDREVELREAAPSISAAAYRAEQPEAAWCCKHTQTGISHSNQSLLELLTVGKPTAAMDEETLMIVAQFKDFNIHHPHRLVLMVWVFPPDISSSPTLKTVVPLVPEKY